jgi:ABC-2 type transport system permease protein
VISFLGAFRMQFQLLSRRPDDLMLLITTPLLTIAILSIVQHAGRPDLQAYAVLGPAIMAIFQMALFVSGELVAAERATGVFEATLTTPVRFSVVLFARILAVTIVSFISLLESVGVAAAFGVWLTVSHPWVLAATLVCMAFAMSGTAVIMAALFVVARSARSFQNSLSYPLFLLGGVIVPIAFLPEWIQPVSRFVFLSWSAQLLRDSLQPEPLEHVLLRLSAIVGLGLLALLVGEWMLSLTIRRVRRLGTAGLA